MQQPPNDLRPPISEAGSSPDAADVLGKPSSSTQPSAIRIILTTGAMRCLMLPVAGASSLLASRLVLDSAGVQGFAAFSILITLPSLIPISDFGIAARLTDVIARYGLQAHEVGVTWRRTRRHLWTIAVATIVAATFLALNSVWAPLLGLPRDASSEWGALAIVSIMAIGIPLGAAQRVLLGVQRQTTNTVVMSLGPALGLLLVTGTASLGAGSFPALAVAYAVGPLLAQSVLLGLARRLLRAVPQDGLPARVRGRREPHWALDALPMAVLALVLPLAYQSDRALLAHGADLQVVAQYAVGALVYMPLLSVVTLCQQPLWPAFMRLRAEGRPLRPYYLRSTAAFALLGLVLAMTAVVGGSLVAPLVAPDVPIPPGEFLLFGALLVVFAVNSPGGMLLMDTRGRWVQAVGGLGMLGIKILLTWLLVSRLGSAAPLLSTLIAVTAFMVVPTAVVAVRRLLTEQDG